MSHNFQKFLFLGVLVLFTGIASRSSLPSLANGSTTTVSSDGSAHIPMAKLSPPVAEVASSLSDATAVELASRTQHAESSTPSLPIISFLKNLSFFGSDQNFEGAVHSPDSSMSSGFIKIGSEVIPTTNVQAAFLGDLGTGESFVALESEKRWPIASLSKLMTAAIATRVLDQNASTTFTASDFVADNSNIIVRNGERYKVSDLTRIMLLASSNEAAEALSRTYGRERFIASMNVLARDWGLSHTFFADPTGLSASNQSTADDLRSLAAHIYHEYPQIFEITRSPEYVVTELNMGTRKTVRSINNFAGRTDFLGGKTGYTDEAGGNLLSIFSYEHKPIIIIVLGTENRFGQTEALRSWFERNYK